MHSRSHEARANLLLRQLESGLLNRLLLASDFLTVEPGLALQCNGDGFAWHPLRGSFSIVRREKTRSIEIGYITVFDSLFSQKGSLDEKITIAALTHGVILRTPQNSICGILSQSPAFALASTFNQIELSRRSGQAQFCSAFHDLLQRVALWLLRLDRHLKGQTITVTQADIGRYLGVERSRVNVCLQQLKRSGILEMPLRGTIRVTDIERLRSAACSCANYFVE